MPYIYDRGNPSSDIWVIINKPISSDLERGYLYSGGLGFVFDKMMSDVGIKNYYVTCLCPDTDNPGACRNIDGQINNHMPRIILPIDAFGAKLCSELSPKRRGKSFNPDFDSDIEKYQGSLLTSPYIKYPHYVMPIISPQAVMINYKIRDRVLLDLAKAKAELDYVKQNGCLQPLPTRKLKIEFECFEELLSILNSFRCSPYISVDIETIYPRKGSQFYKRNPGYPVVIGLAPSKDYGISFNAFRENDIETRELWRVLHKLFRDSKIIGQNFFNFDMHYLEALGFEFRYEDIYDTLIRHHVLWPELPHKLQYLTRQYTRQPYYKDEGQGWSLKNMDGLKRYNCLDCCVTYEVFEGQEEEFNERPQLR